VSLGIELFGAPYSVYVRICRIALAEKGVAYTLRPVDVFDEAGTATDYLALNPFGRIPAFRHGEFELYETDAITAYINEAFDGPDLMPLGIHARARARQIMRLADGEIYRHLVWGVYVPWTNNETQDGLDRAGLVLGELQNLATAPFIASDSFSLADAYVYPMLKYLSLVPEGMDCLSAHPRLLEWFDRTSVRESVVATQFPVETEAAASL
jgi:glutathione S-transferase